MALLTTGLIKNSTVSGVRSSSTLSVKISNADPVSTNMRINGFYWIGTTKIEYVIDIVTIGPGETISRDFYVDFDVFEFRFVTSSDGLDISALGKNAAGNTVVHSLLSGELSPVVGEGMAITSGITIPSVHNQIYVLNSSFNNISVIDGDTNTFMGNVIVGSGPFGIGVNSVTNRIYVANFGSSNVSVIDGNFNALMTIITVGSNPIGVGVNSTTNRIYVSNWGSHSVSVIDGFTHVVIATIQVGVSPEGVNVNPVTNMIYITNHGSSNVTVINGSTNAVIADVEILP